MRRFFLPALIGLVLATPARAELVWENGGKLFSDEAFAKARKLAAEMVQRYQREVSVFSVDKMPAERRKAYDALDPTDKKATGKFFTEWTTAEIRNRRATGVFILLCNSPVYMHILIDKPTRKALGSTREEELARILLDAIRESDGKPEMEAIEIRDRGLLRCMDYLKAALADPRP